MLSATDCSLQRSICVSWKDRATDEEVRARTVQEWTEKILTRKKNVLLVHVK